VPLVEFQQMIGLDFKNQREVRKEMEQNIEDYSQLFSKQVGGLNGKLQKVKTSTW
jgi:hypothetical protein